MLWNILTFLKVVDAFTFKTLALFFSLIHHKKSDKDDGCLVLLGDGSEVLVNLRLVQGLELGLVLGHNSHLENTVSHEKFK